MELIVRATVVYFFLWLVTRGLGKRQLSEMTPFELILLVVIGDLIQQGVTQDDRSITGAVMVVSTIAFWVAVMGLISWRSDRFRRVVSGVPVVVVRNGKVLTDSLDLEQLPVEELMEGARAQGIEDLKEVSVAVLEPDGKFSFFTNNGQSGGQSQQDAGAEKAAK